MMTFMISVEPPWFHPANRLSTRRIGEHFDRGFQHEFGQ
jgi:hypothetical protein